MDIFCGSDHISTSDTCAHQLRSPPLCPLSSKAPPFITLYSSLVPLLQHPSSPFYLSPSSSLLLQTLVTKHRTSNKKTRPNHARFCSRFRFHRPQSPTDIVCHTCLPSVPGHCPSRNPSLCPSGHSHRQQVVPARRGRGFLFLHIRRLSIRRRHSHNRPDRWPHAG